MTEFPNALPKEHRLHEYEIVRVLGVGGFGVTYLALDDHLNKPVAIKEYLPNDLAVRVEGTSVHPKSSSDRDDFQWGLDRFLDEARTLARFDHPSIIRVIRFFEANDTAYIVMDYAEGKTLADHLRDYGTLDEEELKAILMPLLDGLEQVHQADLLHRDIKPDNIIIRADGSPVLIDFGAARQQVIRRSRSVSSIICPGYSPHEQYSTRSKQGPWTDIYALGAVCYVALTGERPPDAADRVRSDPLEPATQKVASRASADFLRAIDHAIAVFDDQRPQSIAQWRATLEGQDQAMAAPVPAARTQTAEKAHEGDREPPEAVPGNPPRETGASNAQKSSAPGRNGRYLLPALMLVIAIASIWVFRPESQPGETFQDCADCPEMVVIPAGSFMMGRPVGEEGWREVEGPPHRVDVSAFALGTTKVTADQYRKYTRGSDSDWSTGYGDEPVRNVSWRDAKGYVEWLSEETGEDYRLPSEAEWEYAVRAGTPTSFYTEDCIKADLADLELGYPGGECPKGWSKFGVPVKSFLPNEFGLYDTYGESTGMSEWVEDCWDRNYDGVPNDGSAWTSGDCYLRVARNGMRSGFGDESSWGTLGSRHEPYFDFSFRVAKSIEQ